MNANDAAAERNYPYDCWWVAATCEEVTRTPVARVMLELPVLLYRTEAGEAVALDNRCPHRWAPLSMGRLVGDEIECGYHGIRFRPDGACAGIPNQTIIPGKCRVRAYPVRESKPFVWVWLGDPERIPEQPEPPVFDWFGAADWTSFGGSMDVEGNYMLLKENVLDLSHFGYVHRDSLQILDMKMPEIDTSNGGLRWDIHYPQRQLTPLYAVLTELSGNNPVEHRLWHIHHSSAIEGGGEHLVDHQAAVGTRREANTRIMHATTPIDMHRFRYYYLTGVDNADLSADFVEKWKLGVSAVFDEDKVLIEGIHRLVAQDRRGLEHVEITLKADQAGVIARRKLAALLARERGIDHPAE